MYANIIQNMPLAFEYIIDLLQRKPEVLERNDIDAFQRDIENIKHTEKKNED